MRSLYVTAATAVTLAALSLAVAACGGESSAPAASAPPAESLPPAEPASDPGEAAYAADSDEAIEGEHSDEPGGPDHEGAGHDEDAAGEEHAEGLEEAPADEGTGDEPEHVDAVPGDKGHEDEPASESEPPASEPVEPVVADTRPVIEVVGGEPVDGVTKITVKKGEKARFTVSSDTAGEVHLHGIDVTKSVGPGSDARFDVHTEFEGIFEIEMHGPNGQAEIASLVIKPS